MAERIQRKRVKGWRMPESAVYVGRPSIFSNPAKVGSELKFPYADAFGPTVRDNAHAVEIFTAYARITSGYPELVRWKLAGKDLACWCPLDQPCHADVLLAIANEAVTP